MYYDPSRSAPRFELVELLLLLLLRRRQAEGSARRRLAAGLLNWPSCLLWGYRSAAAAAAFREREWERRGCWIPGGGKEGPRRLDGARGKAAWGAPRDQWPPASRSRDGGATGGRRGTRCSSLPPDAVQCVTIIFVRISRSAATVLLDQLILLAYCCCKLLGFFDSGNETFFITFCVSVLYFVFYCMC